MICPKCEKSDMVQKRDDREVNWGAGFGWIIGFLGLIAMLFAPVFGILMIIVAIVLGIAGRPSKIILICPACRHIVDL